MSTRFYAQYDDDGKVFAISQIGCDLVRVADYDDRLLGTVYDPVTGTFTGYKIELAADKAEIVADGEDTAIITVTIHNWDDTLADINSIQIDGVDVPVTGGIATYEFRTDQQGEYNVTVTDDRPEIMSRAAVSIMAVQLG